MKYSVISLFSGAMGLDIGLEQAGLNVVVGQDCDKNCAMTAKLNNHLLIQGDIRDIAASDMLQVAQMEKGEPFLVCGGPPCQPFSTAGKRRGIEDPRGSLFIDFVRMIDGIKPRFFLMENVRGIDSARLSNSLPYATTVLDVVLYEFDKLGYTTIFGVLNAVDYGAPQFRERLFIIGSRDHENVFLPTPTHFQRHQCDSYRWHTLADAIQDLEQTPGKGTSFPQSRAAYLEHVPEGGNWNDLPKELQKEAMGGAYESGGGKVGFYRRLAYDEPSPTVVTSPIQKSTMLCHPKVTRPLSVREYARIQGFPDSWKFAGTVSSQYKQIGNAVPVMMGKALGQMLISVATNRYVVTNESESYTPEFQFYGAMSLMNSTSMTQPLFW